MKDRDEHIEQNTRVFEKSFGSKPFERSLIVDLDVLRSTYGEFADRLGRFLDSEDPPSLRQMHNFLSEVRFQMTSVHRSLAEGVIGAIDNTIGPDLSDGFDRLPDN